MILYRESPSGQLKPMPAEAVMADDAEVVFYDASTGKYTVLGANFYMTEHKRIDGGLFTDSTVDVPVDGGRF